ncbi:MAG: DNA-binding transcriptional MerR regulator [Motiliproteus sp.]|jgi:DNA-binding transcriptional MerR regulator
MLSIGQVAKASGCKVQTIRYYEHIGLIQDVARNAGQQRCYRRSDIERLQFIRHARSLGFSTEVIKELLQLNNHQEMSCADVDAIAKHQLMLVQQRLDRLQNLADELNNMIVQCQGSNVESCRIMAALHEHSDCKDHKPLTLETDASSFKSSS